jgi:hypothetical protein
LAGTSALPQEQLDGELDVLVLRAYGKGAAVLKGSLLAPVERHLAHAQQLHPTAAAAAAAAAAASCVLYKKICKLACRCRKVLEED